MSKLPQGWAETTLGTVIDYGATCKAEPDEISEDAWLLELEDIEKDASKIISRFTFGERKSKSTKNRFLKGDVLYGKLRPYLNKVVIADADGYCTTEIIPIKKTQVTDNRYVFYWLRHPRFLDYVTEVSHGLNMPRLGTDAGKKAPFVLAPLPEQKRIADKLDNLLARVDGTRARLDRIPTLLKRFRQSVLAAATSGQLTEDWRQEQSTKASVVPVGPVHHGSECDQPPPKGLVELSPEGLDGEWQRVVLADVAYGFSYGSAAKSSKTGAVPVLRMGNIQDGQLDWDDLVFTSDEKEIAKYRLAAGDVLFNRTNSPELVGKTAVFKGEREAVYAGYLIRVRCSSRLLPNYLNYCLGSPAGRDYCWQVKSDGVSQSNINAKKLAAFEFDLPNITEQIEIVHRVEALFALADKLEAHYSIASAQVDKLTPALLAKAFRGELAPQDPSDEPASKLLARINATRAGLDTKPKQAREAGRNRAPRISKESVAMTKSRQDEDVRSKPYLMQHLHRLGGSAHADELFKAAELPIADFYKQLTWEVKQGMIKDAGNTLEIGDAA